MAGGAQRAVLRTGDRVRLDGVVRTVTAIVGMVVRLTDEQGRAADVGLVEVFTRGAVEEPGPGSANRLAHGVLAGLPEPVLAQARWWQALLVEVITGVAPGAAPKAPPRAQYDPQTTTVAQREAAKAAELAADGHVGVSARTIRRKRQRYEALGLSGLVDGRAGRRQPVRTDGRVVDALTRAVEEATDASSRTASYLWWKVERMLAAEYGEGAVVLPSQATFYRLFDRIAAWCDAWSVGADPPVDGRPARHPVRGVHRGQGRGADADRLRPAGRRGPPGHRSVRPGGDHGDDRCGDADRDRGGTAPDHEVCRREPVAGRSRRSRCGRAGRRP